LLDYKKICIDFSVVRQILRYGVPSAVAASLYPIANLQMQSAINSFGPSAIAGNTACIQYEGIISNIGNGMNASVTAFIGQNMGAKKKDRVLKSFTCVAVAEFVAMLVLSVLAIVFSRPLISVFVGNDTEALRIGVMRMWHTIALYIIALNPLSVTIVTLGYPTLQTAISLVGICGFRTLWMQLLYDTPLLPASIESVYLGFPFSIILTHVTYAIVVSVLLVRFKKGKLKEDLT
jgi:Na+-driven multidrug efflux pump